MKSYGFRKHGIFYSSLLVLLMIVPSFLIANPTSNTEETIIFSDTIPSRENELIVSGWTFPWDPSSWKTLQEWGSDLDEVSPYWYYVLENGTVVGSHNDTENRDYIVYCRANGLEIIPMISNNHDVDVVSNIVLNSTARTHHISSLLDIIIRNGFEGVDINYENIPTALKDDYSNFIMELADVFHNRGKKVYVSVFPKISDDEIREGPGAYDYREIGKYADSVRVMVYNLHWSSCDRSGPITSYEWVADIMEYACEAIPVSKVSLGIPLFGYDWIVDRFGNALTIADNRSFSYINNLLKDPGIDRRWNGTSRTPYLEYMESNGQRHAIHYNDAESLLHEMLISRDLGINRISLWRIGNEDPFVRDYIGMLKEGGMDDLPPYVDIGFDKEGMKGEEIAMGTVRAYDIDGRLVNVGWDFGDGEHSPMIDPTHIFEGGGSFTSRMTVEDDSGNVVVREKNVLIGPYPFFEISGTYSVGEPLTMNANGSWDLGDIVSFNWDLGDGTYQFHGGRIIEHIYKIPGEKTIQLTVINDRGYTDHMSRTIMIPDEEPPFVKAGDDISVWEDMEITLDGRGSTDNSGEVDLYWHLPDGTVLNGHTATISFAEPGSYHIRLEGKDGAGLSSNDTIVVTVMDRTPPDIHVVHPDNVIIDEPFILDISGSSDNVGIHNITWDLPDGKFLYGINQVNDIRKEAGRYYYSVDILDAKGNWNSTSFFIDVIDVNPPSAEVLIDPAPAKLNQTFLYKINGSHESYDPKWIDEVFIVNVTYRFLLVNITDQSDVAFMNWSFGDLAYAKGDSVYHGYSAPGEYVITLNVLDVFGNLFEKRMNILVLPTVNYTLIPIKTYQDVYVEQEVQEEEKDDDPVPITMGIIAIIGTVSFLVILILIELAMAIFSMRRMGVDER